MPMIPFTSAAYQKLKADLTKLQQEEKEILVRLQTAREMGDLSENGAYKYAKFELGSVRRQKNRISYLVAHGQVATKSSNDTIGFGSQVTISDGQREFTYLMVSKYESDPEQHKISIESPLGQALVEKRVGDEVIVESPRGQLRYTVLSIA